MASFLPIVGFPNFDDVQRVLPCYLELLLGENTVLIDLGDRRNLALADCDPSLDRPFVRSVSATML